MPMLDMPLAELRAYGGRNPRPADFDAFWERGVSEVEALGTDCEIHATEFPVPGARLSDLSFTGVGGARVYAKLLQPAVEGPTPALICFHGYRGASGQWTDYLHYCLSGFTVVAMDCRGQGGRSEDTGGVVGTTVLGHIVRGLEDDPEKLLFRNIFLDALQLARIVAAMPSVDETRLATYGGSQGGALSLVCAALEPRISISFAEFPFLCDYLRVWEMDMAVHAYAELKDFFRRFDPTHEREEEWFTKLGYIDIQFLAPRIKAQTIFATALMDDRCPPSSQFAAYNKITSPKEMVLYPDFGHELLPGFRDKVYQRLVMAYAGQT